MRKPPTQFRRLPKRQEAPNHNNPWNTLEVAKLVASILTPIAVVVMGIYISNSANERAVDAERYGRIVERRMAVWSQIEPHLRRAVDQADKLEAGTTNGADGIAVEQRAAMRIFGDNRTIFSIWFGGPMSHHNAEMMSAASRASGYDVEATQNLRRSLHDSFRSLRSAARSELALRPDSLRQIDESGIE